jgi:Na+/pantothenate symporter
MSYLCTLFVGVIATVGALNPPQFLQYIIVFSGGGLAVTFLVPVGLGLYWPRFNKAGAYGAMTAGFLCYITLYLVGYAVFGSNQPVYLLGMDPLIWGFACSLAGAWFGTTLSGGEVEHIVRRYFVER